MIWGIHFEQRFGFRIDRESLVSSLSKKVVRLDRFFRTGKNTFGLLEWEVSEWCYLKPSSNYAASGSLFLPRNVRLSWQCARHWVHYVPWETAFFRRDPLSPPFHVNIMYGLRFLQASALLPLYRKGEYPARGIPVRFTEVPAIKKPEKEQRMKNGSTTASWKRRKNARRASCLDLVTLLRKELVENPDIVAWLGISTSANTMISTGAA